MAELKKANKLLLEKLQENYEDIAEFKRRTGVPLSFETVRRAIYLNQDMSIPALIVLCKYLGFTPLEIKKIIMDAGDKEFSSLIGDQETVSQISELEKTLLEIYRKIKSKNTVAEHLALIAQADGVNIASLINRLKKKEGR